MAVPDTSTFTLQNVTTEIYGDAAAGRNLTNCFADASSAAFDATYSGSKNALLNFRNYITVRTLSISSTYISFNWWGSVCAGFTSIITVTASEGNTWTVTPDMAWITITPDSGTGNGSFIVSVDIASASRSGIIYITSRAPSVVVSVDQFKDCGIID